MNNANLRIAPLVGLLAATTLCGCSSVNQPALPQRARIDNAASALPADELREIVARSDVLYLPMDRLESDEQSGAALRLLNLLQQSTTRAALGWGNVAAELQPLFQEWNGGLLALDPFIARIHFVSAPQRDAVRRLLRELRDRGLSAVPLACGAGQPSARSAEALSCTAENIVREFSALGGGKLLVVIDRRDLDASSGVPFFVGQRLQLRQVVFDVHTTEKARLLTTASRASEIVNAAPGAGGDWR